MKDKEFYTQEEATAPASSINGEPAAHRSYRKVEGNDFRPEALMGVVSLTLGNRDDSDNSEIDVNGVNEDAFKAMKLLLKKAKEVSKRGNKRENYGNNSKLSKKQHITSAKTTRPKQLREMKKWENGDIIKLTEMLEEGACLWDVFDQNYHLREKRERALK